MNEIKDFNSEAERKNGNWTLVGPSFCGKTHLLLNTLRVKRIDQPEIEVKIVTRSPEQYLDLEINWMN